MYVRITTTNLLTGKVCDTQWRTQDFTMEGVQQGQTGKVKQELSLRDGAVDPAATTQPVLSVTDELASYKALHVSAASSSPLQFWRGNQLNFLFCHG